MNLQNQLKSKASEYKLKKKKLWLSKGNTDF